MKNIKIYKQTKEKLTVSLRSLLWEISLEGLVQSIEKTQCVKKRKVGGCGGVLRLIDTGKDGKQLAERESRS